MGRILFDTDELRRLAGSFDGAGGETGRVDDRLSSALGSISLNTQDPGLRAAHLPERQSHLHQRLRSIAGDYVDDSRTFRTLAARVEASDAGGSWIAALTTVDLPAWLGGAGGAAFLLGPLGLGGVVGHALGAGALDGLRDAGLQALHRAQGIVQAGRSALDRGLGLLANAANGFNQAVDWLGDRVRSLVVGAWNAIWDGVSDIFRRLQAGFEGLVQSTAEGLRSAQHALTSAGRFIASEAAFGWHGVSNLPVWLWRYVNNEPLDPLAEHWVGLVTEIPILGTAIDLERYGSMALASQLAIINGYFSGEDARTQAYYREVGDDAMRDWNRFLLDTLFGATKYGTGLGVIGFVDRGGDLRVDQFGEPARPIDDVISFPNKVYDAFLDEATDLVVGEEEPTGGSW
jgi:hypothetical protein